MTAPALADAEKPPEQSYADTVIAAAPAAGITPQIVGGEGVSNVRWQRNFRWVVGLVEATSGRQFCGASLIAPEWVLTAAHCLPGLTPERVNVFVGSPLLSGGGTRVRVAGLIPHPGFDPATYQNDIALLRLAEPLNLPTVQPADAVITQTRASPGTRVVALGWGALTEGGVGPDRLQEVRVPVVGLPRCRQSYPQETIFGSMICAGFHAGGADTCQGDSGGPLAVNTVDGWAQVGITSWGYGCARPGQPGVYTRVANYTDWIQDIIDGAAFCILRNMPQVIRRPRNFDCYGLPHNDDSSAGPAAIGFPVRIGTEVYETVYVNNNGNLTFGGGMSTYTPQPLVNIARPIIAPFFADVDTRSSSSSIVYYGRGMVNGSRTFSAIWQNVGYYSMRSDRLNTFQVVLFELAPGSGNFRIEFNYGPIQWETGNASGGSGGLGGSSARAGLGFERYNSARAIELPGSAIPGTLIDGGSASLSVGTNVGRPGRFAWTVRAGVRR